MKTITFTLPDEASVMSYTVMIQEGRMTKIVYGASDIDKVTGIEYTGTKWKEHRDAERADA